ncbi:MAG: FtsX-like permease family protein [Bacteroidetes bacterium]|nr:MAG: FtsX-like permease family protein [Bacteroidota bacterium]
MGKNKTSGSSAIPTVISIAMVLFMLGLLLVVLFTARKQSIALLENVEMTVMFKPDADEAEVQKIKTAIEGNQKVKSVQYLDKVAVNKAFSDEIGKDFVSTIGYYPLGSELRVYFKSEFASETNLIEVKTSLLEYTSVRDIVYKANLLDKINENVSKIGGILLALCIIFLLVSVTLINGTIRLGLFSQRFSIKTMQLVGATDGFIMKPFVAKAIVHGLYGTLIALLLLGVVVYGFYMYEQELVTYLNWLEYAMVGGALALFAFLLTLISSTFVTRKYLRMQVERLY